MDSKYIVHYLYGLIGGQVGCKSFKQAQDIAESIMLWAEVKHNEDAQISIEEVK